MEIKKSANKAAGHTTTLFSSLRETNSALGVTFLKPYARFHFLTLPENTNLHLRNPLLRLDGIHGHFTGFKIAQVFNCDLVGREKN